MNKTQSNLTPLCLLRAWMRCLTTANRADGSAASWKPQLFREVLYSNTGVVAHTESAPWTEFSPSPGSVLSEPAGSSSRPWWEFQCHFTFVSQICSKRSPPGAMVLTNRPVMDLTTSFETRGTKRSPSAYKVCTETVKEDRGFRVRYFPVQMQV
eukprot:2138483-Rhodomonas_salina.3